MSANPFDTFASDFRAAVPTAAAPTPAGDSGEKSTINIMAQPAPAPVQVMNSPAPMNNMNNQGMPPMGMNQGMPPMGMNQGMPPMGMNQGMPPMGMNQSMQPQMGMNQSIPPQMPNGMATTASRPPMGPSGGAIVPSTQPNNPYANALGGPPPAMGVQPAYSQAPPPAFGQMPPPQQQLPPFGAAPPSQQQPSPFGAPPTPVPSGAGSVSGSVYSQPGTPARNMAPNVVPAGGPFGPPPSPGVPPAPPAPPADPTPPADPWATPATTTATAGAGALVPSTAPAGDDPFGIFGSSAPVPAAPAPAPPAPMSAPVPPQQPPAQPNSDPWADMGFDPPVPATSTNNADPSILTDATSADAQNAMVPHKAGELPPGGEWYDAKIFTPTLGVMFFKPQELTDSLFLQTDKAIVDALDERPVVAFIVEGSSARSAGVELGHVLLKVNGIDVKNPKEASRLIKEGPRPLPLLFYVPDTSVVVAEGEHMVKYDSRETTAPNSAKDWKPKYVVIGGIIAQPWMMNMYRSKSEYDIAVIETQARRPVSVKVKQFSLQGARIQNDWQGPQMVKYKNKMHPWKYIVILPISRNPIKISSPNLSQLKPVHEGIRRVLMAQQRDRGYADPHTAGPSRRADPYAQQQQRGGGGHYDGHQSGGHDGRQSGGYDGRSNGNYGGQAPNNYSGGGMSGERRRFEY